MTIPSGVVTSRSRVCSSRLPNQGRGSDGEDKRLRRHAFSRRVFETRARVSYCWLFRNGFDKITNLVIAWHGNGFPFALGKLCCEMFQLDILKHSHYGWAEWLGVEFPDELL